MTKLKDAMLERPAVLFNWNCPPHSLFGKNSLFSQQKKPLTTNESEKEHGVNPEPVLGLSAS